ncbi:hypothetical protein Asp14428_75690 [Actinoplanes sp. NBRC 14428]|nr:hypothetical protein Asp14428_75690 [Actinoplanes sp. NBRC 14428]
MDAPNNRGMQRITTLGELEAIIGRPPDLVLRKEIGILDEGCRDVLAAAPLAGLGYRDAAGRSRTILAGGRPGFACADSPRRLSLTLPGGAAAPAAGTGVSLVFLLPGIGEVLRLNGSVHEVTDRLVVAVEQAYVHCARAVLRSALWGPPRPVAVAGAPAGDGPLAAPPVAAFLAAAPFLVVSSWDAGGGSDTSPRGDGPGFLRILDGRTLALPDRRGNKRADTLRNVLGDDRISAAVLVPGRLDVLHLGGRARITDDPALLATMATGGQVPHAAVLFTVDTADLRPDGVLASAGVWDRGRHLDPATAPDLNAVAMGHLAANVAGGWKGRLLGLIGKPVTAFPRLTRRLLAAGYRRQLRSEGYATGTPAAPRPGRAVRVAEVVRETPEATTLVLEDPAGEPFDFLPGQFFTLVLDIDGRGVRRAYSASSAPGSRRLALTIKRTPGGVCSAYVQDRVRPGDELRVLGPSGSFHVARPPKELVLLAAGSGITPVMSILRATLATAADTRITLLYGNRTESGIIFGRELTALAGAHDRLTVRHVLSRPGPDWTGPRGRLDPDTVRRELTALAPGAEAHYYACGPAPMLDGIRAVLDALGVPADRRHQELFSAAPAGSAAGTDQRLTVGNLGTVAVAAGRTLLDAGLEAALPMPYSCTVGSCGECRVRLRRGDVTMAEPNCLTGPERAEGWILACVARPLTDTEIDLDGAL